MSKLTNEKIDAIINEDPSTKPKPLKLKPTMEQQIETYRELYDYSELIDDARYHMSKKRRDPTSSSYQPSSSTSEYKPYQPSAASPDYQPAPKKYQWDQLDATPLSEKWHNFDYTKLPPTPRCEMEERFPETQISTTSKTTVIKNKENKPENFKKPTTLITKPQVQSTMPPIPSTSKAEIQLKKNEPNTQLKKLSTASKPESQVIQKKKS